MDPIISDTIQQQQAQIAMQTQVSALKKGMDVQKQVGEALIGLIDSAAMQTPGKAIGLGDQFDTYA